MATLNGNQIIGYVREEIQAITIWTTSPTGGMTDALQVRFSFDTKDECDTIEGVMHALYMKDVEQLREGYPVR